MVLKNPKSDVKLNTFIGNLISKKRLFLIILVISNIISFSNSVTKKGLARIEIDYLVNFHPTRSFLDCGLSKNSTNCLNKKTTNIVIKKLEKNLNKFNYEWLEIDFYESRFAKSSKFFNDKIQDDKFTIKLESYDEINQEEYKSLFNNIENQISRDSLFYAQKEIKLIKSIASDDIYKSRDFGILENGIIASKREDSNRQYIEESKRIEININEYNIKPIIFENFRYIKNKTTMADYVYFNVIGLIIFIVIGLSENKYKQT